MGHNLQNTSVKTAFEIHTIDVFYQVPTKPNHYDDQTAFDIAP